MSSFDLIIVGAGIIGAACADVATREGLKVAIVEPGPIGAGVTAASMGHLVCIDGDPAELSLSQYSQTLWNDLHTLPGSEYRRCGTLWVAANDDDAARIVDKQASLAAAGVASEAVDARQLHELEPTLAPGLPGGLRVPDEGIVYPPAVARQLAARACRRGATWHRNRAISLGGHRVTLDDGSHLDGTVLVANGASLPSLLPELPIRLRRGHLVITQRYPGYIHHQLLQMAYADSVHGQTDSVAFNVQPRPTGQLLIGSSREYGATTTDISLPVVRRMLRRTFDFLPGLRRLDALRIWAGLRPASIDGVPYIGAVADRRGIWVCAGHEGFGVTCAPGSARLLVDQLLGRKPALDMKPFDPSRVAT